MGAAELVVTMVVVGMPQGHFACVGGVGRGCIGGWLCWLGREERREKCNLSLSLSWRELGEGALVGAHFS